MSMPPRRYLGYRKGNQDRSRSGILLPWKKYGSLGERKIVSWLGKKDPSLQGIYPLQTSDLAGKYEELIRLNSICRTEKSGGGDQRECPRI